MTNETREKVESLIEDLMLAALIAGPNARKLYLDAADSLRAPLAENEALKAKYEAVISERPYIVGWNDGFDYAEHADETREVPDVVETLAQERLKAAQVAADGYYCTGCCHLCEDPKRDLEILQKSGAVACCPERKMVPLRSETEVWNEAVETMCAKAESEGFLSVEQIRELKRGTGQ